MRGHEYLVAIVSDNGVLRADTLRYADEIRTPESIGLPKREKPAAAKVTQFGKAIDELTREAWTCRNSQIKTLRRCGSSWKPRKKIDA